MSDPPQIEQSTEPPAVAATLPRSARRADSSAHARPSPHHHRFRMAMAVLTGLGIAAVIVAIAIGAGGRKSSSSSVAWSNYKPSESGTLGARDIADFVAPFYRISAVDQLAVVTVINLETQAAQAAAAQAAANGTTAATGSGLQVAVRPSPTSSQVKLLPGNTMAYNLCGIGGKNCAIGVGAPSNARLLLLRREALELALYTFKYIKGVQNVVAILPPGRTTRASTLTKKPPTAASSSKPVDIAVLFVRQELQPLLDQPLQATFPEANPPTVAEMNKAPEAGLVDQITARGLFSEQLQQAQDGSSLIVLDPLPPQ